MRKNPIKHVIDLATSRKAAAPVTVAEQDQQPEKKKAKRKKE